MLTRYSGRYFVYELDVFSQDCYNLSDGTTLIGQSYNFVLEVCSFS